MADAEVFSECLRTTRGLVRLSLPNNLLDYDLIKILSRGLMLNKTITHLDLAHNKIGNSACSKIALYLYQSKILTHLYLGDNLIHEKGCRCIGDALKVNKSLKVLDFHLNRIDDKGGVKFCQTLNESGGNRSIETLIFRGNSLDSQFTMGISTLLQNREFSIKHLDISCNIIKTKDALVLKSTLESNNRLLYLDIRNNVIDERKSLLKLTGLSWS